ncbi:hypothetical protein AAZX31_07G152200 [Glycine max]|uniref:Uncharacterized protein n=2 Tax=Glycine subgen. Soja TaxID=1462606 RepID=I1KKQ4_SOYBN|nr:extra-large guanine nucleotide-binding protein 1-like [Glycine max]KAG5010177.1 hypothetical protein JHK87_018692 [Glycine soja]KAG5037977.1 hypothetical protein JHK86_018817 [Glycine max]KAG5143104.1 hypothetical protein JHK82_018799 [Glycine max]KAH1087144.1 hypothetical protein GYH30_018609 [Glycine max]KAH1242326.1 hypothetical protein GmHk_07G019680 [Glycine max]|eukprot:NP_001351465.1 extra-large guanine nucleotide-binding protein 1-like [Glycine max]
MSAMVEGWKGELTKLREKVVMARKSLFSKGKEGSEEEERVVEKEAHKAIMAVQRDSTHETMSEATVCLLMDRFVPC